MSKKLPFFKFYPSEWFSGNIRYHSFIAKGLFIDICSLYWQKDCQLKIDQLRKIYMPVIEEFEDSYNKLIKAEIIKEDENGNIMIDFLNENKTEIEHIITLKSSAGKASAEARRNKCLSSDNTSSIDGNTCSTPVQHVFNTSSTDLQQNATIRIDKIRRDIKRVTTPPIPPNKTQQEDETEQKPLCSGVGSSSLFNPSINPPNPEKVKEYAETIGYPITDQRAEEFCNYYGGQGWVKANGRQIADWRFCVRDWRARDAGGHPIGRSII